MTPYFSRLAQRSGGNAAPQTRAGNAAAFAADAGVPAQPDNAHASYEEGDDLMVLALPENKTMQPAPSANAVADIYSPPRAVFPPADTPSVAQTSEFPRSASPSTPSDAYAEISVSLAPVFITRPTDHGSKETLPEAPTLPRVPTPLPALSLHAALLDVESKHHFERNDASPPWHEAPVVAAPVPNDNPQKVSIQTAVAPAMPAADHADPELSIPRETIIVAAKPAARSAIALPAREGPPPAEHRPRAQKLQVQIGRIELDVTVPPPAAAHVPAARAETPSASPPPRASFNAHRHYLRAR